MTSNILTFHQKNVFYSHINLQKHFCFTKFIIIDQLVIVGYCNSYYVVVTGVQKHERDQQRK